MAVATERKSADERREAVLDATLAEFAARGFEGASTQAIAKAAGISQPYVFRLFGTKKELILATIERCMRETLELMQTSSAGLKGEAVLEAIADAYMQRLPNSTYLRAQLQAYAACGDPDVRAVVRRGYGEMVHYVERASGLPPEQVARFFAKGMLFNVVAAMDLLGADEGWAQRLIEGCRNDV